MLGASSDSSLNYSNIIECKNIGKISGFEGVSGVITDPSSYVKISKCLNAGELYCSFSIQNGSGGGYLGGVAGAVGWNDQVEILDCYNTGTLNASNAKNDASNIGGVVAFVKENVSSTIKNCYNVGQILINSGSSNRKGGIIGFTGKASLTNNYWLNTCGANYGCGSTSDNTEAVSKTSSELKSLASILGTSYKTDSGNKNQGYPILDWENN